MEKISKREKSETDKKNNRSALKIGLVVAGIIIFLCIVASCSVPTPNEDANKSQESAVTAQQTENAQEQVKEPTWHTVKTYSGVGDKTTSTFKIKGDEWRVKWSTKAISPEFGVFYLNIYQKGSSFPVEDISHDGSGSDTTYIYSGKDTFYLEVSAANLSGWKAMIQDKY